MATDMKGEEQAPLLINVEDPNASAISKFWTEFKEAMSKKENLIVLMYVLLYVASGIFNSIMLKKTMNCFENYPFFLTQLLNYGYIPIFGAVVLYQVLFTNNIPAEMRQFPWWKFLIMGALDAVNGYVVVIGGVDTSGPLQQLLNQAIIPFTMLGAFIFLKERYSWVQMGGALIIVAGVVISLLPSFTGSDNIGQNKIFFNIFYLLKQFLVPPLTCTRISHSRVWNWTCGTFSFGMCSGKALWARSCSPSTLHSHPQPK